MNICNRLSPGLHVIFAFLWIVLSAFTSAVAAVPTPTIEIAATGTHGFPFLASALDLSKFGYVEQEFLISGAAQAFTNTGPLGTDGKWATVPTPGVTANYKTRLLVRRPAKAQNFNGTVIVEWLNVSQGMDAAADWPPARDELLREGYAWVGVSAQLVGVAFLQTWESGPNDRYATVFHPGNSFSYDIFSQGTKALVAPGSGVKPLGALTPHVRELLAAGMSQSAGRLVTYYNAVQPLAHLFDGFLIHAIGTGAPLSQSFGGGFPPNTLPVPAGVPATPDIPVPPTSWIRNDLQARVLFVNTETEMVLLSAARSVHLQPDSPRFRMWEIAGTSHGDRTLLELAIVELAKSGTTISIICENPPINDGPQAYAIRAAVHALRSWVRFGWAPTSAPRFSVSIPPLPGVPAIQRDPSTGLVIGGVRLPDIDVPIATNTGERPPAALAANPTCVLFGAHDPWNGDSDAWDGQVGFDPSGTAEPVLSVLYPTHGRYVHQVVESALDSVFKGYLRPADAVTLVKQAAHARVPD